MLRAGMLETKRAKLMVAVGATLLLAAFQVALQAKPAHAWEVSLSIKGAGQVTEVTDRGLIASDCAGGLDSPNTTPTGQIGDSCSPGSPGGLYAQGDIVEYRATPKTGFQLVGWRNADDPATYNPVICDNSGGSPNYLGTTATNCRFQIFQNLKAQAVFADTSPPSQPSITNTTPTVTNGPVSFNFSTSADSTLRGFECRVTPTVQPSFQSCNSGVSFNPTSNGTYSFEVRAVDWSNNTSFAASRSWTVDKAAPVTSITSGPSAFSFSNNNSATFNFSSNEPAGFECSLTGPGINTGFDSCFSGRGYTGLPDGSHTFSVRSTDSAGNASTISRTWTIDTVAPDTTLDPNVGPAPNSTTQENDPVFQFSSSDTNTTFECNLVGPGMTSNAFTACSSPKSYPNLIDGTYTFKVRAKDRATNVDGSPEERTWTINNTPTVLADSLTPVRGATGVSRTIDVGAAFSEEMAPTSIANLTTHVSKTFKLQQYNKRTRKWMAVPATVHVGDDNKTATLDPFGATEGATEKLLASRQKFRATITTGVTDAQGNRIAKNFVWIFTTGSS